MKKIRIDVIAFVLIITGLLLANFLNFEKETVSALENRMLKTKPEFSISSLFNGSYFRDYEEYYSDTFIKRDNMVRASRDIKEALSLNESGITLVVTHETAENINSEKPSPGPTVVLTPTPIPVQTDSPNTNEPIGSG